MFLLINLLLLHKDRVHRIENEFLTVIIFYGITYKIEHKSYDKK